jgi:hypothetical protein
MTKHLILALLALGFAGPNYASGFELVLEPEPGEAVEEEVGESEPLPEQPIHQEPPEGVTGPERPGQPENPEAPGYEKPGRARPQMECVAQNVARHRYLGVGTIRPLAAQAALHHCRIRSGQIARSCRLVACYRAHR